MSTVRIRVIPFVMAMIPDTVVASTLKAMMAATITTAVIAMGVRVSIFFGRDEREQYGQFVFNGKIIQNRYFLDAHRQTVPF